MIKTLLLPFVALVGIMASANLAAASYWNSGQGIVSGDSGSIQTSLLSPCALAKLQANHSVSSAPDVFECAQWLQGWLGSTPPDQVENLLEEFGLTELIPLTPEELNDASIDVLASLLTSIPADIMVNLQKAKTEMGAAVPCATGKPMQPLACKQGRVCTGKKCTKKDGTAGNCRTKMNTLQNELAFWFCPNATMHSFHCEDECPAPGLPAVLGLLGGLGLVGRRRKQAN